jgi:uncharacterized protein (DUF58 family)
VVLSLTGLWISVITGALVGLAAVPAILFVAFDFSTRLPEPGVEGITVTRRASEDRVLMNDPVLVELVVENLGPAVGRLLLRDTPPTPSEVARGSVSMLCGVRRGGKATLRYEVRFGEAGEYKFGPCRVMVKSMFGLAEKRLAFDSPLAVRVYPRHLVRSLDVGPAAAFGWSGTSPSRFKGGRLDFVSMRAYSPGDPLKDVNWKASARLGKTLVNEWHVERGLDCILTVNLSLGGLPKVGDWNARSEVITAAYELASSLIRSGNRVGLLALGDIPVKIGPGFGTRHLHTMVEHLVDTREGTVWSAKYTESFLEMFFRRQYRTRAGTLFFVFAWPDEELVAAVTSLSKKGFACNSVLVDVLERERRSLVEQKVLSAREAEFGARYAHAEQESFKLMLASVSVVHVWRAGEGFIEVKGRPRQ